MAYAINSNKIAKNTIALYIRMGVTMIISFFATRVTLEQLGVDDYGLNNLVGSIVSMFSFINGSLGGAVQRFFNIEIGRGDNERLAKVFGSAVFLHIIVAIITFVLAEVFAYFFLYRLNIPSERLFAAQVVFQISILSLALNILTVPNAALLRAREMFSKTALVEIIQAILRLIVLYLLVHISYDKLITLSILNLGITVYYFATIYGMSRIFKEAHTKPLRDKEILNGLIKFVSLFTLTVLSALFKNQGVVVIVNLFFGLAINAAYAVANQVSNYVDSFALSFKSSIEPQMVSAYGAGDKSTMIKLVNVGTKITFLLLLMISFPVIFEGEFLLDLWLKTPPNYAAKLVALALVAINIGSFPHMIYKGTHASGKVAGQQIWIAVTNILVVISAYVFFKLGAGFETAFYISIVAGIIQCAGIVYFASKTYDYSIRVFLVNVLFPCSLIVVVISMCMWAIVTHIDPSLLRFVLLSSISEIMIILLGYGFVLNKTEKRQVSNLLKGVRKRAKLLGK